MQSRGFESNKGTMKAPREMKGLYCLQPFTNIDIHSNHGVRCCSESWMPTWLGDFSQHSLREIWNSESAKRIRESILNGTYEFCDWHQCPFYSNSSHYLFTEAELMNPGNLTAVRRHRLEKNAPWVQAILEKKTELDLLPANYNLAYDESCNLKCPSCRSSARVYLSGPEYQKRMEIHQKLLSELSSNGFENIGRLNLTGSGEPFISRIFKNFLIGFDHADCPNIDINIQSNGIYFTPEMWAKMEKVQSRINEVIISLDASVAETYDQIRVNGNYSKLLLNLKFLSGLRKENKIKRLMLAFVVQKKNFSEMKAAVEYAKEIEADLIIFNLLNDWKSWKEDEYEANAIWKSFHPDYQQFLSLLQDPVFSDPIVELGNLYDYKILADHMKDEKNSETLS